MRKQKDFFEYFLQGLDAKLAAQLRLDQQRQKMREEFVRRQELEKLKNEMRIMIEEGPDSTIYGYQSFIRQSKEFDYVFHFVKYFNILVSTLPKHYQPDWFVCFIFSNTLSNSLETMNGKRRIVFTPNLSQTFELSINSISTP